MKLKKIFVMIDYDTYSERRVFNNIVELKSLIHISFDRDIYDIDAVDVNGRWYEDLIFKNDELYFRKLNKGIINEN